MTVIDKHITLSPLEMADSVWLNRVRDYGSGLSTGWQSADQFMSLKKGYPLMIAGDGGVGKTEFVFDLILNSCINHKWRWLILSPEVGNAEEVLMFLVLKLSKGKGVLPTDENQLPVAEYKSICSWLHKHFRILDRHRGWDSVFAELELNLKNLSDVVDREEKILGGKFDGILIDPFNELDMDLGSNIAGHVKSELDTLLRWTKSRNYVTILTNHTNAKNELRGVDHQTGQNYLWTPPARKEDWAYGQQFARKGYQMILVYEPHRAKQSERAAEGDKYMYHSIEHTYNVREFFVQKSKPKGVGRTGKFYLFYNRVTQRYYEIDSTGLVRVDPKYPQI